MVYTNSCNINRMKKESIDKQMELFYKELNNPKIVIGDWCIVNKKLYSKLKKTNIIGINNVYQGLVDTTLIKTILGKNNISSKEIILIAETKKEYIVIKYNSNFVAIKFSLTEYGILYDTYELLAVNRENLLNNKQSEINNTKELISLVGARMTKKAIKDLEYFESF